MPPLKWVVTVVVVLVIFTTILFLAGFIVEASLGVVMIVFILWQTTVFPRLSIPELAKEDTVLCTIVVALAALPFTIPASYSLISNLQVSDATFLAVSGIIIRPIGRPVIELLMDFRFQSRKLWLIEELTGKRASEAHELNQLSRSGASAEALYTSALTGVTLTKALPFIGLEDAGQRMVILVVMVVGGSLIHYLHPLQKDLRTYLKNNERKRPLGA